MMSHAYLLKSFWGHLLIAACYTLNRFPSKLIDKTPSELWKDNRFNLSLLKVWSYNAYVKRTELNKLEFKFDKCIFMRYSKQTIGYQFYNPIQENVIISSDVVFLEKVFVLNEDGGRKLELETVQESTYIVVEEPESNPTFAKG